MLKEFKKFKGWLVLEYFLKGNEKTGIRELSRKLNISSMTAKHYCDEFESSGLLISEKAGTAKLFSLKTNKQTIQWRIAYLLQIIDEVGLEAKIKNPFYIHGNTAKGTWNKGRDLNLFIIMINDFNDEEVSKAIKSIGFVPNPLIIEYHELESFKASNPALIQEIKKGIYFGDPAYS